MLPTLFRIESRLPPEQVKRLIQDVLVDWFESREAPRGWILGPVMCIWRTAVTNDNTFFAVILRDGWRTRIVGLSLFDLTKPFLALCLLALLWLVWSQTGSGEMLLRGAILFSVIIAGMLALVLWWPMSKCEPRSVRFLRQLIEQNDGVAEEAAEAPLPIFEREPRDLELVLSGKPPTRVNSASEIVAAFRSVEAGTDEFMIIALGEQHYVQSAPTGEGFLLEWRDGSGTRHFSAKVTTIKDEELSAQDALELLLAYAHDAPWPNTVTWIPRFGV